MLLAGLAGCAAMLTACTASGPGPQPRPTGPGATPTRPNIVFVLTDDLSWNLMPFMPHVAALQSAGMTFTNYTVTDSLCCPSRASIFTGDFPHDTHVTSNAPPAGGDVKFRRTGDDRSTFATSLAAQGYRTVFMGKYLNGYQPDPRTGLMSTLLGPYVPPGWSTWNAVGGGGYAAFDYSIADGHDVTHYGTGTQDYLNTVLQQRGVDAIRSAARSRTPFLLEVATFSPHSPYVPAPSDVGAFHGLPAPRTAAYGRMPRPAPHWLDGHLPLDAGANRKIDRDFEKRVETVQSVDRMIGALWRTVRAQGQAANTVFVFSSDNGFHMGEYTLRNGKQTAFDTDIRVPLVITGPGIAPGSTNSDVTENIDLRPTFDEFAAAATPASVDGRSLVPLLHGQRSAWRTLAGIEHHNPPRSGYDPDRQTGLQGIPPTYAAIRSSRWIYVRYVTGDREYYDLSHDPQELHNLGPGLSPRRRVTLDRMLARLVGCHGAAACWAAGRPTGG
ncbi:MAG: sulfatase family protein [Jatrophihabitantaceae bacterium]